MFRSRLTLSIGKDVADQLGQLARLTGRTRSALARAAISSFIQREQPIVEGISRGLADVRAGRVVTHEEAMRTIDATIARATKKRPASRRTRIS
jgi:predicted transcriptional regulator